eukprot:2467778-Rhodomonas_salina.1
MRLWGWGRVRGRRTPIKKCCCTNLFVSCDALQAGVVDPHCIPEHIPDTLASVCVSVIIATMLTKSSTMARNFRAQDKRKEARSRKVYEVSDKHKSRVMSLSA